jgi:hypothetical protein
MKNDMFDKIIIIVLICICAYQFLSKTRQRNESHYYIDPMPYEICGKKIYVTDFTYNSNLDIQSLFNEIEYICKK